MRKADAITRLQTYDQFEHTHTLVCMRQLIKTTIMHAWATIVAWELHMGTINLEKEAQATQLRMRLRIVFREWAFHELTYLSRSSSRVALSVNATSSRIAMDHERYEDVLPTVNLQHGMVRKPWI